MAKERVDQLEEKYNAALEKRGAATAEAKAAKRALDAALSLEANQAQGESEDGEAAISTILDTLTNEQEA